MPDQDAFEAAPSDLRIGDHTLLSLACSITREQFKRDRLDNLNQILWTIRYAYICGMQRGAADANDTMEALLRRLPAEPDLPGVEHGIEASNGFRGDAR
jgi:hypothetical protein